MAKARLKRFIYRLKTLFSPSSRSDIHSILAAANPNATLEQRVLWLQSLIGWIRSEATMAHAFESEAGRLHWVRMKFVLKLLDRDANLKAKFALTLRSILEESEGVELFARTGLTQQGGLFSELLDRIVRKVLPAPMRLGQLDDLLPRLFTSHADAVWVGMLPAEILKQLAPLFWHGGNRDSFRTLRDGALDALVILSSEIAARGLMPDFRHRLPFPNIQQSPFLNFRNRVEALVNGARKTPNASIDPLSEEIESCQGALERIYQHLDKEGVSVNLVYHIECQREALRRSAILLEIFSTEGATQQRKMASLLGELIRGSHAIRGFRFLLRNNMRLLSQKIVERAGASGEHYIAHTKEEYRHMLWAGLGGGALTVPTTIIKVALHALHLPLFIDGFLISMNYGISFFAMQLLGFTLATKQPAMTGPALAGKLKRLRGPREIRAFVEEVRSLTRTQFAAVFGNIGAAIPVALALDWGYWLLSGKHLWNGETATYMLKSIDPFTTLTMVYAAFTGVILWSAGLVAGWVENWFVWRQLPQALAEQSWIVYLLGRPKAQKVSQWMFHNIGGLASCFWLGFCLGFSPIVGEFFGLPIDIRHVTLSSAALALATSSLVHNGWDTWLVVRASVGILVILTMNFSVSFFLAFMVAVRARDVSARSVWVLLRRTAKELGAAPLSFFLPRARA